MFKTLEQKCYLLILVFVVVKRSWDGPPLPEVGGAPSEGPLTLVSNVLGILVNVVLDMIGNLLNLMLLNT